MTEQEKMELAYRILSCIAKWPGWVQVEKKAFNQCLDSQSQRVKLTFCGAYDPPIKDETGLYPDYAKKDFNVSCSVRGLDFWERLKNITEKYDGEFSKIIEGAK